MNEIGGINVGNKSSINPNWVACRGKLGVKVGLQELGFCQAKCCVWN